MLFPSLGNHQHHCLSERITAHDQQFKGVVERSRVRLAWVVQGPNLLQVVAENGGGNCLLTGLEPVHIATNGVDFAVMRDVTEGVGQIPGREGIG